MTEFVWCGRGLSRAQTMYDKQWQSETDSEVAIQPELGNDGSGEEAMRRCRWRRYLEVVKWSRQKARRVEMRLVGKFGGPCA